MSLVKFHARNHRQQTMLGGPDRAVDDRATTPEVFDVQAVSLHIDGTFRVEVRS